MILSVKTATIDMELVYDPCYEEERKDAAIILRQLLNVNLMNKTDAGNDDTPCELPSNKMLQMLGLRQCEGKAIVGSRDVARVFDKDHRNVLRSIAALKALGMSDEFSQLNFERVTYTDQKGQARVEYLMTRDGFTMLAMGFTGPKAMRFKEAYIKAFNVMERMLAAR